MKMGDTRKQHSRGAWRAIYRDGLKEGLDQQQQEHDAMSTTDTNRVLCQECGRSFRRESDNKRHNYKYAVERLQPNERAAWCCLMHNL